MDAAPPSEVERLIAQSRIDLVQGDRSTSGAPTDWSAILRLHRLASREVLDASLSACLDADPVMRRVGAAVLGQLGHTKIGFEPVFLDERYRGLALLLKNETEGTLDPAVLQDVCVALGHLHDPRAIPALIGLLRHADAEVRLGVAHGLAGYESPEAIEGLIALSSDADDDVRDWATFELGQLIGSDTPAIRAALHARLNDPGIAVRHEAIEGLATRGDRSALPALIRELRTGVTLPLLDAAVALAMPELCEALVAAAAGGLVVQASCGPYDLTEPWKEAMRVCGCNASDRAGPIRQ